jgi:hypothetical protein
LHPWRWIEGCCLQRIRTRQIQYAAPSPIMQSCLLDHIHSMHVV